MNNDRRGLYPEIEPYETGMLDVGEGQSLYYERVGTPGAKPAVFLHGGPGGGIFSSAFTIVSSSEVSGNTAVGGGVFGDLPGWRGQRTAQDRQAGLLVTFGALLSKAAVRDVGRCEHIEEATAMRKLMTMGYELYLAGRYRNGAISLRDVAHRLDLSLSEAMDRLSELGVPGNVTADDTLQSLKSLPT